MALNVGTSGFSYKEWKGAFYPEKLPNKDMLAFYGKHFSAVEINASSPCNNLEDVFQVLAGFNLVEKPWFRDLD